MSTDPNSNHPRPRNASNGMLDQASSTSFRRPSNALRRLRESISRSPSDTRAFVGSPIARAAIAQDIEQDLVSENGILDSDDDDLERQTNMLRPAISHDSYSAAHLLSSSYSRPTFVPLGHRTSMILGGHDPYQNPTQEEQLEALQEERSLLRDNNLLPPKHPQAQEEEDFAYQFGSFIKHRLPTSIPGGERKVIRADDEDDHVIAQPTEETPLIGNPELPYGGLDDPEEIERKWEEAIAAGKISTTWQREAKTITKYSAPLILTFILQSTLTLSSVLVVGRIGVNELAAVSLAVMSSNITGYAPFQGLGTALDTLCAQAYGSGKKKLVGLQMQRGIWFLWCTCIPIAVIWLSAEAILVRIVPDAQVARLAGVYLKILLAGAPGWAAFECGKRYMQAQGKFNVGLYVLLICAPINAILNYVFVWTLGMGFIGAPLAVAITDNLLPLCLFLYVRYVDGIQCWPGFTKRAFQNWGPMIKLALPGLLMVESECLAFEILTLASSYFGTEVLAAQSILSNIVTLMWQVPFPLSISCSTRVANLIGATLVDGAKLSCKVGFVFACTTGLMNLVILASLRNYIPYIFTSDEVVINIVAGVLPLCAAFQLFDSLCAWGNGILRGLGRQEVGGYVQLFCYYVVAMPVSFGTGFGLGWGIMGLWLGCAIALGLVCTIETFFIMRTDWNRSVEEAMARNEVA